MHRFAPSALVSLLAASVTAQSFVNYESPLVQPLRLSADGLRLYAAHTADNRLAVYSLANPNTPVLLDEIPVGLEPVSVNARTADEVWVVNHLSDSVSIVSIAQGRVVATLRVKDEPSDVVFAGGKAFVTAAASDNVQVFDAVTRTPLGTVAIFGKDQKLAFYNKAFVKLWDFPESLLEKHPSDGEILDRLRDARKLPEQRDYQAWKRSRQTLYADGHR